MIRKAISLVFFISIFVYGESQELNYRNAPFIEGSNYFEVVKKNRTELEKLNGLSDRKSRKKIKQFERWAAFWKDRVLPDGSFVSSSFLFEQWLEDEAKQSQFKKEGISGNGDWTIIGPLAPPQSNVGFYPGMGRINALAFSGTDINTLYVGSPSGGVWKSADGGSTWKAKTDDLPVIGVSHIVINPTNVNELYIATGDFDGQQTRSLGVYKSTNGGDSWNVTGLSFALGDESLIAKLLIDPNNTNTIFATTKNSIKRSTDGGSNWTDVYTENEAFFNDIQYKIGSASVIYATSKMGRFYVSTNNGTTWTVASSPSNGNRLDIALTNNDVDQILVIDDGGVLRKSTNQGTSWTTVSTISNYDSQGGYNIAIAVSPLNKDLIIVGGIEGWRSTNGGTSWEKYLDGYWETGNPYFYVHSDHHDMMFVPNSNIAFSLNDGGIFKGDASASTKWTDLSSGLAITQYYKIAGTPKDVNLLMAGAQDNDVARYNGTTFYGENAGSDGVEGLWDYSNSDIAWSCSQSGGMNRTTDGFSTTQQISAPAAAPFVWELEMHPTIPTTIYGGFDDIYKSTDRGDNWSNLSSGAGFIEFISISPSNPDVIYVSGENGVKKTTNGGTSWASVTVPQSGNVKSIEVHPTNPSQVYIAYSGYLAGKVYKSTDGGANWTNITGSLPNIPTHKILYRTGSTNGELFLATDLGVYYRTDSKGDWVKLSSGLPNVIVNDIEIHYGSDKLRAATFGRGIWERSISSGTLGVKEQLLDKSSVILFPNPASDSKFTLKLDGLSGESKVLIYNIVGSVVKSFTMKVTQRDVDLSAFSRGIYLVKVINNEKSITQQIIVE